MRGDRVVCGGGRWVTRSFQHGLAAGLRGVADFGADAQDFRNDVDCTGFCRLPLKEPAMGFSASDVVPFTQARANHFELADQAKAGDERSSRRTMRATSR